MERSVWLRVAPGPLGDWPTPCVLTRSAPTIRD